MFVALVWPGTALAGVKSSAPVTVDWNARHASGAVGSARNGSDSKQSIGCSTSSYSDGSSYATCTATDANGVWGGCSTSVPNLVDAARNVKGDTYISFYWDANGACTTISGSNYSSYEPKNP
jgi:hypothetical protein